MRRFALAVALVSTLACSDSISPESVAGTYDLVSINGQTLPFSEPILGSIVTVNASRMWLAPDSLVRSYLSDHRCRGGSDTPRIEWLIRDVYT